MTPDQLFSMASATAMAGWILLILFPRQRWSMSIVSAAIPALLAGTYTAIIVTQWAGHAGGFQSLSAVAQLFEQRWLLLAGWVHYLAFDLFVGSWEVRDAQTTGVPHLLVVPCLVLTFLFGPIGWLLYGALRTGYRVARPSAA